MTVEILLAASIIAVSVLAMINVVGKSIALSRLGLRVSQASFLLEEGAEAVRVYRDNNTWTNFTTNLTAGTNYYPSFSGGTWTFSTTPSTVGIFTRKIVVTAVNRDANSDIAVSGTNDTGTKLITVTVSWTENGTSYSKTLSFYIADIFS